MDPSVHEIISRLRGDLAGVNLLVMGQTVFWDEPLKAALCRMLDQSSPRVKTRIVAGIHDLDYFSRLRRRRNTGAFILTGHDDGPTSGLWVSAAETSQLFGSETVLTRALLNEYGVPIETMAPEQGREEFLAEATSAWGWRGVAFDGAEDPIAAAVPVSAVLSRLVELLEWAISETSSCLRKGKCAEKVARDLVAELRQTAAKLPSDAMLPQLYLSLAESYWRRLLGASSPRLGLCAASELFRFNTKTAALPRFRFLDAFLNPKTRAIARRAYNEAVRDSDIYTLEQFSEAALPFDVVLLDRDRPPCRGTICVADNEVAILGPCSTVLHTDRPPANVSELAALIERHLGPDAILVGKAVTLVPMILSEWVWVLHQFGSAYTPQTRRMIAAMRAAGLQVPLHPILRVEHDSWSALRGVKATFRLPIHLARAFGADEITADEFASRWREAVAEQEALLEEMKGIKNPEELTDFLTHEEHAAWLAKLRANVKAHSKLLRLSRQIERLRHQGIRAWDGAHDTKQEIQRLQKEKGHIVRQHIRPLKLLLKESPADADSVQKRLAPLEAQRSEMEARISSLRQKASSEELRSAQTDKAHHDLEQSAEFVEARRTVAAVEHEAHLLRLRLVRHALITVRGLPYAAARPAWWWFPMVDPTGAWFDNLVAMAKCRFEEM